MVHRAPHSLAVSYNKDISIQIRPYIAIFPHSFQIRLFFRFKMKKLALVLAFAICANVVKCNLLDRACVSKLREVITRCLHTKSVGNYRVGPCAVERHLVSRITVCKALATKSMCPRIASGLIRQLDSLSSYSRKKCML